MGNGHDDVEALSRLLHEKDAQIERLELENAGLRDSVTALEDRIAQLEAMLSRNSKNSSMPPSAEGFAKPPVTPNRAARRRRPGKQPGDQGHRLEPVEHPDHVVIHTPERCSSCDSRLVLGELVKQEVRQVFDLPEVRAVVTEHRAETWRCGCGTQTTATFPPEAIGPTCYGPGVRALLTYLVVAQHLPIERATQVFEECCGIGVSSGFATSLITEAGTSLDGFVAATRHALRRSPTLHLDETGARVAGTLGWVHSASTSTLTSYLFHRRRGRVAIDEFDVLPGYSGVCVHDGWTPYRAYDDVTHGLCNAHHLRELQAVVEVGQPWADELASLLVNTLDRVKTAKAAGHGALSSRTLNQLARRYDELIVAGHLANPPPVRTGKKGRPSRTKTANLVDRLDRFRDDVLRFATDFSVPFDNNQAERDLRMVKLQQKISGCYRTEAGATNYLTIRSYVSTARKQGINVLEALRDLFEGKPFMPGVAAA
jgi:transposase